MLVPATDSPLLLGIDCGTQSLRAGVYDSEGRLVVQAVEEFETQFPQVGWAEQNPQDWLEAARVAIGKCLEHPDVSPEAIAGTAVDATACTPLCVDEKGEPLRPALLWMDQRAHREAEEVNQTGHPFLKYVGGGDSPEWGVPKCMWLKRNEPDTWRAAAKVCDCADWLTFKLTGKWIASLCNATAKWNYVRPEGGFPEDLLRAVGLDDALEKWPTDVRPMGELAGELTSEAAQFLGLKPGTPVAVGGIDAYTGMIGLNVVSHGRMALVIGSSTCHMGLSDEAVFGSAVWGPYPDALIEGTWVLEGGQTATGSIVKWFADNFAHAQAAEAERRGISRYEVLDEQAAAVPPGAEGVILIDYFQGNRTPLRDPLARGAFWGLSLRHGPGHMLRAIYEGTAFGTRHILEDLAQAGFRVTELYACGGGAKSSLWLQITADVCQIPIITTEIQEATALGAAILGGVAAGIFPSIAEGAQAMVREARRTDPNPELKETYDFYFDKYVRFYPAMKELMHEVAQRAG